MEDVKTRASADVASPQTEVSLLLHLASFGSLGLLIGLLTGMTASSVVASLLGLLFALLGGSLVAFFDKLDSKQLRWALLSLCSLSVACILGLFMGILLCEFKLLSPRPFGPGIVSEAQKSDDSIGSYKYLKNQLVEKYDSIHSEYQQRHITAEQAYEQLYNYLRDKLRASQGEPR
jgi:hypothetical protein